MTYTCEHCGCEIDESLLLGYKDEPLRGLCNNCRPLILAELWCQDHPEECEENQAQASQPTITVYGDGVGWHWRVNVENDMSRRGWEWSEEKAQQAANEWLKQWEEKRG